MGNPRRGFFADLDAEFHFNLDPCATPGKRKVQALFYGRTRRSKTGLGGDESILQSPVWSNRRRVGQKGIRGIEKAGNARRLPTPARTDTRWFHDYIIENVKIRFVRGRLKFGDGKHPRRSLDGRNFLKVVRTMNVIIAIHKEYADLIFEGKKTIEVRKGKNAALLRPRIFCTRRKRTAARE